MGAVLKKNFSGCPQREGKGEPGTHGCRHTAKGGLQGLGLAQGAEEPQGSHPHGYPHSAQRLDLDIT